jgi:hypothetical protein
LPARGCGVKPLLLANGLQWRSIASRYHIRPNLYCANCMDNSRCGRPCEAKSPR